MTSPAPTTITAGTDRENLILNTMLATITTAPTDWLVISKAVGEQVKIRSNGWMAVRNLLQWLMDSGYVAPGPFDDETGDGGDTYVLLLR